MEDFIHYVKENAREMIVSFFFFFGKLVVVSFKKYEKIHIVIFITFIYIFQLKA